jgi:antitoxin component of MazEF toxin-antitoxin module
METLFKAKVRRIGTSLGLIIPNELVKNKSIKEGEEVEIALLKKRKELIAKIFGVAKGASSFERHSIDRV